VSQRKCCAAVGAPVAGRSAGDRRVVPRSSLVSAFASTDFFHVIPKIAPLLGGRSRLHDTLAETTRALGTTQALVTIVEDAGLEVMARRSMGFGMVAGIVCRVPGASEQPAGESVDR